MNEHVYQLRTPADDRKGQIKSLENELRQLTKDKSEAST